MRPSTPHPLLTAWRDNPFAPLTLKDIMRRTGKNSKAWVFNTLNTLARHNLVTITKVANANTYTLTMDNPLLPSALHLAHAREWQHQTIINDLLKTLPQRCFSLLVFGSHADGTATKDSDIDICILVDSKTTAQTMKPYARDVALRTPVELDIHYVTFDDFITMLLRDDENLAKQVFRKHTLHHNPTIYYRLINEAHNHGFRP